MDLFGTFSGSSTTKNLIYTSIHYTPSYLARSIVENTLRSLNLDELDELKILDPACGSAGQRMCGRCGGELRDAAT